MDLVELSVEVLSLRKVQALRQEPNFIERDYFEVYDNPTFHIPLALSSFCNLEFCRWKD